jgi:hypothetical protein
MENKITPLEDLNKFLQETKFPESLGLSARMAMYNYKHQPVQIKISKIPKDKRALFLRIQKKECYRNAFLSALAFLHKTGDVRYVLGFYTAKTLPLDVEHAWIKVGKEYYDPTVEIALKKDPTQDTYYSFVELTCKQAWKLLKKNRNLPPSLLDVARLTGVRKERKKAVKKNKTSTPQALKKPKWIRCYTMETGETRVLIDHMELPLEPSLKICSHSPTGFNWGYRGSGPAQLALALLLHLTNDKELALQHYQQFKTEILAKIPQGNFVMPVKKVLEWLEQQKTKTQEM